jgi:hypothetical protein
MGSRVTCESDGGKLSRDGKWEVDVRGTLAYDGVNRSYALDAKNEAAAVMEAFRLFVSEHEPEVPK